MGPIPALPPPEDPTCPRPYATTSPWNAPIGSSPRYHPQSAYHVTALQGVLSSDPTQYTYPVYQVTSTTASQTVSISGWFSNVVDGGARLVNQRAGTIQLPIPAGAQAAAGSDAQMILINPATGDEWGVSNLARTSSGGWSAWNAYHYNTGWTAVPPADSEGRPFFARGAGVPYLAGLVRPCEIARGRIDHALAFAYDFPTGQFVYPATKSDGDSSGPPDMPEGARLQLDPAISAAEIQSWGCTGPCLTIAKALQDYGMYIIDNSGRPKVMMEYEATAGWNGLVNSKTPNPIPLNRFKLIDHTAGPPPPPPAPPGTDPVLAAAGDIAYGGSGDEETAKILDAIAPTVVVTMGDNAYDSGTAAEFTNWYQPTWGRHKSKTRPSPGNHDYRTSGASGYFGYFGSAAGTPGKGWYSYDIGSWHLIALNTNGEGSCATISCSVGSEQERWLRADLAATQASCVLAYFHHPRFSTGPHGDNAGVKPLWQALYDHNADVILQGHDHNYQRWAPMNPDGQLDPSRGIRSFVVGTGGKNLYSVGSRSGLEAKQGDTLGVLKMTLRTGGYDWDFEPVAGKTYNDSGTGSCH